MSPVSQILAVKGVAGKIDNEQIGPENSDLAERLYIACETVDIISLIYISFQIKI